MNIKGFKDKSGEKHRYDFAALANPGVAFGGYDHFYDSIARLRVNPTAPLDIETYDGSGQLTHPCVRYFPEGWNGHPYWMAASPYPNSAVELENPCVWFSGDGRTWSAEGVPNPLDTAPMENGAYIGYNSDPHLLVRADGVMEVWWRTHYQSGGNAGCEVIYRRTSADGSNWGAKEELHRVQNTDGTAISCLCPVALHEDGIYKIWIVYKQQCLRYYESTTGADWQYIRDIDVNHINNPHWDIWHFDINHTGQGYEFVGEYMIPGDYTSHKFVYYAVSQDNITYSTPVLILMPGEAGSFDGRLLYRPSIIRLPDRVMIYYGAQSEALEWHLGLIEAPTPYLFDAVRRVGERVRATEGRLAELENGQGDGENVKLPVDESGNPVYGTAGQHAVSDGKGGIQWVAEADTPEAAEDILLGTLPMTISESNCYLLAQTNATISTGEGAAQLLDFDVNEPYIGDTTYNGGTVEKLGKNTIKVGFTNTAKNALVHFPTACEVGKTYTFCAKLLSKSDDVVNASSMPIIKIQQKSPDTGAVNIVAQLSVPATGDMGFKAFEVTENTLVHDVQISFATNSSYTAGETYATIVLYLYEGTYTELPTGATFDVVAGEKYPTDGYMGATLSAVNGEKVEVYRVNTAGAEGAMDEGGVIFFGDSILHYSDVITRYAAKTGKSVIDCAVGGTRMSASRDSSNAYYPVDMANIANAIASGDFSAQLNSGVATAGFTTLASSNIANYKAIVLEFGANDFTAEVPFEGDDAASIAGAVRHILTTILTKYPNMRIVVLSTLQYVTLGTGTESGVPTHDDGTVWQMNEVIRDVCESDEFCVPWVDMYHAFGQNGITRNTLNSDGCHLASPNGAKRYADILIGKLNALGI